MAQGKIRLFTIGFTNKSARQFFGLLESNNVRTLIDTRINNTSQLAGFAKGKDLAYFCEAIAGIRYEHRTDMAPTQDLLATYRKQGMSWQEYTECYLDLLRRRKIENKVDVKELDGACFLCSEHLPDQCHRRLLAEYLSEYYPDITLTHLTS